MMFLGGCQWKPSGPGGSVVQQADADHHQHVHRQPLHSRHTHVSL